MEKNQKSGSAFKAFTARITAYKAIDPIVFSLIDRDDRPLTGAWHLNHALLVQHLP